MVKLWCALVVLVLSSPAVAGTPDGDGTADDKKAAGPARVKSLEELNADLEAQRVQLEAQKIEMDAQKAQIQSLLKSTGASMSLEGSGALPAPQDKATLVEVKSKWALTIYGYIEAEVVEDNRQVNALVENTGNPALPAGHGTYATEHSQLTFSPRNSRLGLTVSAPEYAGIRVSGRMEFDFLGGGTTVAAVGNQEQNAFWINALPRIRHMYVTADTDYVTATIGQGWELFGWQPYFFPCTVDDQGIPNEIYSRSPKLQFTHAFKGPVTIEPGVSISRPVERDANSPDLQAGLKVTFPDWVGVHSMSATSTAIDAAGVGVSACYRDFRVPRGAGLDTSASARGDAICGDLFLPLLHPAADSKANSLSLTGEVVYGAGINDLYAGFTGGVPAGAVAGIGDQGEIGFLGNELKAIQWRTTIVGLQYYLPGDGTWWVAVNYSADHSRNIGKLSGTPGGAVFLPGAVFKSNQWLNADIFWDLTPALRLGMSVDQYRDTYVSEAIARDTRFQFSVFLMF